MSNIVKQGNLLFTDKYLFDIFGIVVLQFGKDGAMQMEKHREAAFLIYFILLAILVVSSMLSNIDLVNIIYLVVVLSCFLKFILIVNKDKI